MAGAVAVGMLREPRLAGVIMAAHYLGAIAVGLLLKFLYRPGRDETPRPGRQPGGMLTRALRALVRERRADGRPFGEVLGDAVRRSVDTLLLIGGFIILFATLTGMLRATGATAQVRAALGPLLEALGLAPQLVDGLLAGFFEISIGTEATAQAPAPLLDRTVACSAIIAWSGASVVAQVAAVTRGTGVDMRVYAAARAVHAILAALFTWALWPRPLAQATLALPGGAPPGAFGWTAPAPMSPAAEAPAGAHGPLSAVGWASAQSFWGVLASAGASLGDTLAALFVLAVVLVAAGGLARPRPGARRARRGRR